MSDLGKGLGTIGIWAGVGVVAFAPGAAEAVAFVAFWGAIATLGVWLFGRED